jgi:cation:H+ antiporter
VSRSCSSWWGWGFSWPGPRSSSRGAVDVATALGVSGLVVGLTVVALGTSLPELAASVVAVRRGQRDLAIGNVVGNCLLNLGLVLGVPAILVDGGLPVPAAAVALDIPVMPAAVVALLPNAFTGFPVARWEGGLFLLLYFDYTGYVLLAATEHDALEGFSSVMVSFVLPLVVMTLVAVSAHELGRRRERRERRGPGGPAGAP